MVGGSCVDSGALGSVRRIIRASLFKCCKDDNSPEGQFALCFACVPSAGLTKRRLLLRDRCLDFDRHLVVPDLNRDCTERGAACDTALSPRQLHLSSVEQRITHVVGDGHRL